MINPQENNKPFAGTARLDNSASFSGACPSLAKPNNIRLVENTPLFIEDMTEESTTKFIIIAAPPIPACINKVTNGL